MEYIFAETAASVVFFFFFTFFFRMGGRTKVFLTRYKPELGVGVGD